MWDRIRRLLSQLKAAASFALLPAAALDIIWLTLCALHGGQPLLLHGSNPALCYLIGFLVIYLAVLTVTALLRRHRLMRAFSRLDAELIGKAFGGFSRRDRLFSRAIGCCAANDWQTALDILLQVADFEMTREETGVCAFYTGRCYQLLNEPQTAAYHFQRARENGFSTAHALLFEARSCEKAGNFDRAFTLFIQLLELPAPESFDFLYTDIGFVFIRQNDPRQAAEWFRKSIEKGQCFAYALSGMAMAALLSGHYRRAMQFRTQALLNQVDNPEQFQVMFDTTRDALMAQHPDWDWSVPETPPEPEET